jgi:hypothetical protein
MAREGGAIASDLALLCLQANSFWAGGQHDWLSD